MRTFHSHLIGLWLGFAVLSGCAATRAESQWLEGARQAPTGELTPETRLLARAVLANPTPKNQEELRALGPEGLRALVVEAKAAKRFDARLDPVIDRVAGQRYARHSELYWHTDLDSALEQAKRENKPVLSLRMLGDLREDLSCANSRFFRVVLYPDPYVRPMLSNSFVLHWSSERPVPVVTVDYGDGRKLVRTVTGNSIHYVLDREGRVVEALPGLMAPIAFRQELQRSLRLASAVWDRSDDEFATTLRARHAEREVELLNEWKSELAALGITPKSQRSELSAQNQRLAKSRALPLPQRVSAMVAVNEAPTKAVVERPMLPTLAPLPTFTAKDAERESTLAVWQKLAEQRLQAARLSSSSIELMRELAPQGFDVAGRPEALNDVAFRELVENFERSLALDTVKNRLDLGRRLHERLGARPLDEFDDLNEWVYSAVFLTPRTDPWLGLGSEGVFTALPSDGVRTKR